MTSGYQRSDKPRLLDLFCGAGGAAVGYHRAGFEVVGVDIKPQPRYPFEFHQGDAMSVLAVMLNDQGGTALEDISVIHASPPCQSYSRALRHLALSQPELLDDVRELLQHIGLPWVMENVEGAPMPRQDTLDGRYGVELCGTSFGLRIQHHRLFESSIPLVGAPCRHNGPAMNPHNKGSRAEFGWNEPDWAIEKGITWTKHKREYRDAIPPAYTEFIGTQLMAHLKAKVAA